MHEAWLGALKDIDILLADAYLLRRWQLNLNCSQDLSDTRTIQAKAGKLLQQLKLCVDKNPRAASEVGLLNIAQKDHRPSRQTLRDRSGAFSR